MCLVVLARNVHPHYPLVVVANRDEEHDRATKQAHWWGSPNILAGQDVQRGGTWLGVNRQGKWGTVTNYREGTEAPGPRSRGELVVDFLSKQQQNTESYLSQVANRRNDYSGFSVLLGDLQDLYYFSNRDGSYQKVDDGIHTLSNSLLDTPWPKTRVAHENLEKLLERSPQKLEIPDLVSVLSNSEPFDDDTLPDTGIGIGGERMLSPLFIKGDDYGTLCTTVLLIDTNGKVTFVEQTFCSGGIKGPLASFEFVIT